MQAPDDSYNFRIGKKKISVVYFMDLMAATVSYFLGEKQKK